VRSLADRDFARDLGEQGAVDRRLADSAAGIRAGNVEVAAATSRSIHSLINFDVP
jgi:hypothetical protein